jgi:copper transport protein
MSRALVLTLLVLLALPAGAAAHASLIGGDPEPGGVAPVAPRAVTIRFDEAVDPSLAVVRVEDARGRRWDAGAVTAAPGHAVRVALRRGAPDGRYVVLYRVVSDDGHTIPGGFGFAVGRDATPPPAPRLDLGAPAGLGTASATARAIRDGGLALAAGALLFGVLIWPAALGDAAGAGARWLRADAAFARVLRRLVGSAALAAAAASVALVLLAAAPSGISERTVSAVLRTHFGLATTSGAALLLALGLATALVRHPRAEAAVAPGLRVAELGATGLAAAATTRRAILAAGATALALAAVPVLAGHATTRADPALLVASGTAHVLAASAWIGGIAVLLTALAAATRELEPPDRTVLLRAALRRFSSLAAVAVGVLALTGAVQALVEVGAPHALTGAAFGRAVLIKAGLLLVVVGIAAAHRLDHLPGLAARAAEGASPGPLGHDVRRTLRLEALGLVALLAATGALAGYAPPGGAPPGPAGIALSFEQAAVRGQLAPARAGTNTLSFTLSRRAGGLAFDDLERIAVLATGPGGRTVRATTPGRRDGTYHLPLRLPAQGSWRLTLTLRVDAFNAFTRTTRVVIH